MEQVLDHVEAWGMGAASILFGAVLAIIAVDGHLKKTFSSPETVVRLSAGAALATVGLLYPLDIVRKELVSSMWMIVFGMLFILEGIGILSITMTGGLRKSLSVLGGSIFLLWGLLNAPVYLR
jgi:hypothetical protein